MTTDVNWLGGIPLGKITNWQDNKVTNMTPITFPGGDAGQTEVIDTMGVTLYITITGRLTGTFHDLQTDLHSIKSVADGLQTSAQNLRSPYVNSKDLSSTIRKGNFGTNTSVSSYNLIDTSGAFITKGIQAGDYVKNLVTGQSTYITIVYAGGTELFLAADIFPNANTPYAVTATIGVKVISFDYRWDLPGLSFVDYTLQLIQVAS